MSNAISGSVATSVSLSQQLDAGASRLQAVAQPVTTGQSAAYTPGTGPYAAQKIAVFIGTTTISTPVDVDLTAITCVDGTTGFAHVRELVILNLDLANPLTVGDDGVGLYPWTPWALGTTPRVLVQPLGSLRIAKPIGTTGYAVTGAGSCKVRINPGAYAVSYQLIVLGD